jgi:hypothetical protein
LLGVVARRSVAFEANAELGRATDDVSSRQNIAIGADEKACRRGFARLQSRDENNGLLGGLGLGAQSGRQACQCKEERNLSNLAYPDSILLDLSFSL